MSERFITVNVFRDSSIGDCTMNGVTSPKFNHHFVVPAEGGNISREVAEDMEYVILKPRVLGGETNFVPERVGGHKMFGGNFVYSCDGRFGKTYGHRPVAVHDRVE